MALPSAFIALAAGPLPAPILVAGQFGFNFPQPGTRLVAAAVAWEAGLGRLRTVGGLGSTRRAQLDILYYPGFGVAPLCVSILP